MADGDTKKQGGAYRAGRAVKDVLGGARRQVSATLRDTLGNISPLTRLIPPGVVTGDNLKRFVEGVQGAPERSFEAPVAATPAARVVPAKAVDQAMQQGRVADLAILPQDRINAQISKMLAGPMTRSDLRMAQGLMPAPTKPRSGKDTAADLAIATIQRQYAEQLATAEALDDQVARGEAKMKAADNYRNWLATIAGAKTSDMTLQDLLAEQGGE